MFDIDVKRKYTFNGGIHPHLDGKLVLPKKFIQLPLPDKVRIPLLQHIGGTAKPLVKVGDTVKTGQPIGEASGFVSAFIHSTISGKVTALKKLPVSVMKYGLCAEITSDGQDDKFWVHEKVDDWTKLDKETIKNRIFSAGIVGMGGAGFPTHVKLTPGDTKKIEFIIINGVECEPYLDADRDIMCTNPDKVIQGLQMVMSAIGCECGFIGIEKDKPDAISIIGDKLKDVRNIKLVPLEVKYPQGAEKQLIYSISKREIPQGALPMDVGALVINAATSTAIFEAVTENKPLIERSMTIAGNCLNESVNIRTRIGTIISSVINHLGGFKVQPAKAIMGGPMMGETLFSLDLPVTKTTSGLIFLAEEETNRYQMKPCIRCGRCVDICPAGISPAQIGQAVEFNNLQLAESLGIFNCIKCGCCSYVCPAKRELVQLIKLGEQQIKKNRGK